MNCAAQISRRRARTDGVARAAEQMAFGVAGFLALLSIFFPITRAEVPRFLDPLGDHPAYSFTRLEIITPADDTTRWSMAGVCSSPRRRAGISPASCS